MNRIEPGDAFAFKVNSHRHEWNGLTCANPLQWNCGADRHFRETMCDRNTGTCYHQRLFSPDGAVFFAPDSTVAHFLAANRDFLDDQIIFFCGSSFDLKSGRPDVGANMWMYGVYRVKNANVGTYEGLYQKPVVIIRPYDDGWAIFPRNQVRKPATPGAVDGVTYLTRVNARAARETVDNAFEIGVGRDGHGLLQNPMERERLAYVHEHFDEWAAIANERMRTQAFCRTQVFSSQASVPIESSLAAGLRGLKGKIVTRPVPEPPNPALELEARNPVLATTVLTPENTPNLAEPPVDEFEARLGEELPGKELEVGFEPAAQTHHLAGTFCGALSGEHESNVEPAATESTAEWDGEEGGINASQAALDSEFAKVANEDAQQITKSDEAPVSAGPWVKSTLPEPIHLEWLEREYGRKILSAVRVASLTKNLMLFAGPPGVGKSWISARLVDDPKRERSIIVPVSSTWRGRDDLLGYVNPISGCFEPTAFTQFLLQAEEAWDTGDHRTHLVILEEINLSQTEHWFSDLLVRLEYDLTIRADRTIVLGGQRIAGYPPNQAPKVFLPPTLMFVGTLNNDHTVRSLTPRVLDRSAVIELSATGRVALQRVGAQFPAEVEEIVEELNSIIELRGAAFSVRSARSLVRAAEALGNEDIMQILDLVLAQEVLSKIRLMAGDPRDDQLLGQLLRWADSTACDALTLCKSKVSAWEEFLQAGQDVTQA